MMNVPDGPTDVDDRLVEPDLPQRFMIGVAQSQIIAALDAIDPAGDPEHAHGEADKVLLAALGPEVKAAYDRLVARTAWWAFS